MYRVVVFLFLLLRIRLEGIPCAWMVTTRFSSANVIWDSTFAAEIALAMDVALVPEWFVAAVATHRFVAKNITVV